MTEKLTIEQLQHTLAHCTGTAQWYKDPFYPTMLYTDGIKLMAETAGAFWLVDYIGFNVYPMLNKTAPYKIRFTSNEGKGTLSVWETGAKEPKFVYPIEYTDFPQGSIEMYLMDNVLLLPSEY